VAENCEMNELTDSGLIQRDRIGARKTTGVVGKRSSDSHLSLYRPDIGESYAATWNHPIGPYILLVYYNIGMRCAPS